MDTKSPEQILEFAKGVASVESSKDEYANSQL